MSEPKDVTIYTRGVSSLTGSGGYATILLYKGRRKELSGGEPVASNNRMDLRAAIEGLRALKQPCRVVLYNNNTYLVDAIARGWAAKWRARGWTNNEKKPTPHFDLWKELLDLCAAHEVSFVYRPLGGHDRELSRCDLLAHEAARSFTAQDRAGKAWDRGEDAELAAAFDAGQSVRELAAIHRRTEGAIQSRLIRLGRLTIVPTAGVGPDPVPPAAGGPQVISETGTRRPPTAGPPAAQPARPVPAWKRARPRAGKPWTPDEDGALLRDFDAGLSLEEIAGRRGRGVFAIEARLFKLGRDATARGEIPASFKPGDVKLPLAGTSAQ